jgi:lysophospholipase L1-like esterase
MKAQALILLVTLAACSGGGGGSSPLPSTQHTAAPQGAYNAVGDSITNNGYVAPGQSFPAPLGQALGIVTTNLAQPGFTIADQLSKEVPLIGSNCTMVTLEAGGGDIINSLHPAPEVIKDFGSLFEAVKAACPGGRIVLSDYINNGNNYGRWGNLTQYNDDLRQFAQANGVLLVDIAADKRFNDPPFPSAYMHNGVHPNAAGEALIAQDIEEALK